MGFFTKKKAKTPLPPLGRGKYHVIEVENWFINKFTENDMLLNALKLQKLLFLAYGWVYLFDSKPLFKQPIEAFPYGPIVRETYRRYKPYGGNFINAGPKPELNTSESIATNLQRIKQKEEEILTQVFEKYGTLSPIQLSSITHQTGGAWDRTMAVYGEYAKLNDAYIKTEFLKKYDKQMVKENEKHDKKTSRKQCSTLSNTWHGYQEHV